VLLDGVAWYQVYQDGLDAARGDVRIRPVKSGVRREDHVPKGVKRSMMVLGGARWSIVGVDTFGWVGLDSLTETEDG
jgi:hypothetical protein